MDGLKCYSCNAEEKKKCHYARDGDGSEDPDDHSWFGDTMECEKDQEHCMISRTRMI